jgi:hypothetical protein
MAAFNKTGEKAFPVGVLVPARSKEPAVRYRRELG